MSYKLRENIEAAFKYLNSRLTNYRRLGLGGLEVRADGALESSTIEEELKTINFVAVKKYREQNKIVTIYKATA